MPGPARGRKQTRPPQSRNLISGEQRPCSRAAPVMGPRSAVLGAEKTDYNPATSKNYVVRPESDGAGMGQGGAGWAGWGLTGRDEGQRMGGNRAAKGPGPRGLESGGGGVVGFFFFSWPISCPFPCPSSPLVLAQSPEHVDDP